jgi:hypothetical protein
MASWTINEGLPAVTKTQMPLLLAVTLFIFGAMNASSAETQIQCRTSNGLQADGKSPTTLFGTVHSEGHWGPPNFGEHPAMDAWFTDWILDLDDRMTITWGTEPKSKFSERTREVQLMSSSVGIAEFDGAHVRVEGTLEDTAAPSQVTDFVLVASAITKVPRGAAPRCTP